MFRKLIFAIGAAALAGLTLPVELSAQSTDASELSAKEIEEIFNKQKTRGLVLEPSGTDETAATEDSSTTRSETYVQFDAEDQVNIQIKFDFDSAALREDQRPKLSTLCKVMQNADFELFRIVGHTDASGSANYNKTLSRLRAEEVKRHLTGDCGIAQDRLEAVGVGEEFPVDDGDPRAEVNRRVEFQALS